MLSPPAADLRDFYRTPIAIAILPNRPQDYSLNSIYLRRRAKYNGGIPEHALRRHLCAGSGAARPSGSRRRAAGGA